MIADPAVTPLTSPHLTCHRPPYPEPQIPLCSRVSLASPNNMGSDFKAIPLIDISPLVEKIDDPAMAGDEGLLDVVRMLDDACREAGFFYVCYTPIEPGRYGDLAKPMEGSNLWPDYPSNFDALLENYISLLRDLSRKIMRGIALALGAPLDAFEGGVAGDAFWVLRLIGYPISDDIPQEERTDIGCGAHTDYGLLTLVNQDDDICALEVRNQSGEWIYAKPVPGTFVCNIGDMLKVWSNGIYQPTLHRVVNNSPRYRVSVAFFYESNFDAAVEPVEFCREKTGGVAKYEKVVYGEHLVQKVLTNFVM
ncbi:2-oxoglutarate-dependent dioxygenase 33 isoform X2 [Triticum aestivum]|uniref:2-oxoglutarate-dependent dioxygenase 33 isoform X2 n=1 Tax=Triticum aestivum TaxID=4565 RepID=UPI001D0073D0|nr:2-oxoglutarate-dependent dioxygenase 33-like isoform X2 [Triticum aestivum]